MYLRFISPWPSNMRNVDYGIFQAVYRCRDEQLLPGYLLDELLAELSWFKKFLPNPDEHNFDYAGHRIGRVIRVKMHSEIELFSLIF